MRYREFARVEDDRVHILRDGHMLRGSDYGPIYAVSIVTDGFRLPDSALIAIRNYVKKFSMEHKNNKGERIW